MNLITQNELAARLGASKNSIRRLVEVGKLPSPTTAGRSSVWTMEDVEPLLHADPPPEEKPPAVMVKVGPRQMVNDTIPPGRSHVGWTANLDPMDPSQIEGIDRWWSIANAEDWIEECFIVSCVGFVLAVYRIIDVQTVMKLRHFKLGPPRPEMKVYEGVRFPSEAGPMSKSWR